MDCATHTATDKDDKDKLVKHFKIIGPYTDSCLVYGAFTLYETRKADTVWGLSDLWTFRIGIGVGTRCTRCC